MKKTPIQHLWFDFSDMIAHIEREEYNRIMYAAYAKATGRSFDEQLKTDFAEALKKQKSNSAVFAALGLPSGYLADALRVADPKKIYCLADEQIPTVLQELRKLLPVSIFSNNKLDIILPALGIDPKLFAHILGPDVVKTPKPALDGFYKMIELSDVQPSAILYVGDDVDKDLLPAKKVWITTGLLWKESEKADLCFRDFQAILDYFETAAP